MINKIKLTDKIFNELRDYIYSITGIYMEDNKREIMEMKLFNRMKVNNMRDVKDYFTIMKNEPTKTELKEFIDLLTVNETYFFRNMPQLLTFQEKILPLLLEENKKTFTLKIWSAGISMGCEPYTLALILKENIPDFSKWKIYILGNDISKSALKVAKSGLYTEREIKNIPKYLLQKYFAKIENYYKISDEIIKMVDIQEFNLMDFKKIEYLPIFDVVFCRNVLIYFNDNSRKKVVDKFYEKLKIPGYIFLGHSESLNRISKAFSLKRFGRDLVYVKE